MSTLNRGIGGRIESRYDLRTLLEIVAAVARLANPSAPLLVRQADYDAARADAGYPDAPTGKQTAQRFGLAWRELLTLALDEERNLDKAVGHRVGADEDAALDEAGIRAALRTVALRLDRRTLTVFEYRREREEMLASASLRHHPVELYLPSDYQILRVAGSWEAALEISGLDPRVESASPKGLPIIDAIEIALEATGCLPTRNELHTFAAANGFSVARGRRPFSEYVAELSARRDGWGKWTPLGRPPHAQRPDWGASYELPRNVNLVRKRRRRWTREECIAALGRLLDELGNERLTQRVYQQRTTGRRDLPPLFSLQRHGKFSELLAEARKRRSKRAP